MFRKLGDKTLYEIMGKSQAGTEVIEFEIEGIDYAYQLLAEYQMAFGSGFELWIVDAETKLGV